MELLLLFYEVSHRLGTVSSALDITVEPNTRKSTRSRLYTKGASTHPRSRVCTQYTSVHKHACRTILYSASSAVRPNHKCCSCASDADPGRTLGCPDSPSLCAVGANDPLLRQTAIVATMSLLLTHAVSSLGEVSAAVSARTQEAVTRGARAGGHEAPSIANPRLPWVDMNPEG